MSSNANDKIKEDNALKSVKEKLYDKEIAEIALSKESFESDFDFIQSLYFEDFYLFSLKSELELLPKLFEKEGVKTIVFVIDELKMLNQEKRSSIAGGSLQIGKADYCGSSNKRHFGKKFLGTETDKNLH